MEYTTQKELYLKLLPVFKVKNRLISKSRYNHITNEFIWSYLSKTKWCKSHNLTISEIVNDIITVEPDQINKYIGGTK